MARLRYYVDECRLVPLFAFIFLPVLVVYAAYIPVAQDAVALWPGYRYGDMKSWWKAAVVIGIGLWMLVLTCLRVLGGWRPSWSTVTGLLLLPAVAILVSAFLSPYQKTAWIGGTALFEGAYVLLAYLVAVWFTYEMVDSKKGTLLLLRMMGVVCWIEGVYSIFEGFGYSLWYSDFFRWLVGAESKTLTIRFASARMASGTVYQPNHFGMIMAMLGALALGMIFYESKRVWRIFWGGGYSAAIAGVFCSNSRAAILVLLAVTVLYAFYYVMNLKRQGAGVMRRGVVLWACLAVVSLGVVGYVLPNDIFSRFFSRVQNVLYSSEIDPIHSIELQNNRLTITLPDRTVTLEKRRQDTWRVSASGGESGTDIQGEPASDGWLKADVPYMPDTTILYQAGGGGYARLDVPHLSIPLYTIGTQLRLVDKDNRLLWSTVSPSAYRVTGFEGFANYRGYIWSRAMETWRQRLLFGYGPGTFAQASPYDDWLNRLRFAKGMHADKGHGIWSTFLVQVGLVGLLSFSFPVLYVLCKVIRHPVGIGVPIALGMAAYVLCSLTNDSTVGVTPIFCILVGLGMVVIKGRVDSAYSA